MDLYREINKLPFKNTNDRPIGEMIKQFVKANRIEDKYYKAMVIIIWKDTMGKQLGRFIKDIYVKNRKLHMVVRSSSMKQEIRYQQDKIVNHINDVLSHPYLRGVQIW